MSQNNDTYKTEAGPSDTGMLSREEILRNARQDAANFDAIHGMINPADRRFTVHGDLDHPASLTLRERTTTGVHIHTFLPQPNNHRSLIVNVPPPQHTSPQPNFGLRPSDLLLVASNGQQIGHFRLTMPPNEFRQLLSSLGHGSTNLPLQVMTAGPNSRAIFTPPPRLQPSVSQPTTSLPVRPTAQTVSRSPSAPAVRPKKKAKKSSKPPKTEKPKDWSKAVEKPAGATKAETDFCLTCVQNNRSCKGTNLVWIQGEYRCQNCAEIRESTGSRRCLWADPANGVTEYKHAQKAAKIRGLWANTVEGKAARKARKEMEAAGANSDDETDGEEESLSEEEEPSQLELELAADTVLEQLRGSIVEGLDINLDDEENKLYVAEVMQILYHDLTEMDQAKPIETRRWTVKVGRIVEARMEAVIIRAKAAIHDATAIEQSPGQSRAENVTAQASADKIHSFGRGSMSSETAENNVSGTASDGEDDPASGGIDSATVDGAKDIALKYGSARRISESYDHDMDDAE